MKESAVWVPREGRDSGFGQARTSPGPPSPGRAWGQGVATGAATRTIAVPGPLLRPTSATRGREVVGWELPERDCPRPPPAAARERLKSPVSTCSKHPVRRHSPLGEAHLTAERSPPSHTRPLAGHRECQDPLRLGREQGDGSGSPSGLLGAPGGSRPAFQPLSAALCPLLPRRAAAALGG